MLKFPKKAPSNLAQDVTDIFDSIVEKAERGSMVLARVSQGKFSHNVIDALGKQWKLCTDPFLLKITRNKRR